MRKLAAIMFTDIVGYTALMGKDEQKALQLLQKNRGLHKPIIEQFRGEWLKEIGDGTLSSFASAVDAVNCALAIQQVLKDDRDLKLRIGIHVGDVVFEEGDVFGDGVNVASRIEPLAEPGGICITGRVHDDIRNKPDIETTFIGEQTLKGVARPIKVYALTGGGLPAPLAKPAAPGGAEPASKRKFQYFNLPAALFGGLILAALGYVFLLAPQLQAGAPIPIAVVDFVNETSEPELDGLSGMLITALEQSHRLAVLTRSRMFDILKQLGKADVDHIDEALGKDIARKAYLDVLIIASIRKLGRLYIIDLKALAPDRDEYLFTAQEQGEGQESILTMLDKLAEKTRIGLKEKIAEVRATSYKVADVTTSHLEAYQHYFKGEELINKLRFDDAIEEFQKAIAIDSTFGLAYYRLAYASGWGREQVALEQIQKALALINRFPDRERYLVRAEKANLDGEIKAGIAILKAMEQIYPDDKEMLFNIGDWSYHADEYTTAVEYLEKVLTIDPTFERALQHLSWTFRDLEQFDKMMEVERRFVAANKVEGNVLIGDNYYYQGEYAKAVEYLEKVLRTEPTHRDAVLHLIWAYRELEQPEKVLEIANAYASAEEDSSSGYAMLRNAYRYLRDYGGVAPTFFLPALEGESFYLSRKVGPKAQTQNKMPILISFFQTVCVPSDAEISHLSKLQKEFPEVGFYLINVKESKELVQEYKERLQVELPILMDTDGAVSKMYEIVDENNMAHIPQMFIIDAEGNIFYGHLGYKKGEEAIYRSQLAALVAKKPPVEVEHVPAIR